MAQIWLFDKDAGSFTKIMHETYGARRPLWRPDGAGFYYVGEHARGANLCQYDLGTRQSKVLTRFPVDSVVFPSMARDGSLLVSDDLVGALYRIWYDGK